MSKQRQPRCGAGGRESEREGRAAIFQSFHRGLAGPRTNDVNRLGGREVTQKAVREVTPNMTKYKVLCEFGTAKGG